ncbi:HNH endonuclease [Fimbriiglobus ruber]|uniref:HNH endonuclease n=1 Tax=Fimbriiglobus ruber TaxID=1908690 RepID=UPI000B4B56CA|nr:HNH endonuclease [Fimbriiglobus ruber]
MKSIPLTQGQFALVDAEEFEYLSQFKWYADRHKRKNFPDGFMAARKVRKENGKQTTILMHREIMCATKEEKVDHHNHDELDNRKQNLRICSQSQNCQNKRVRPRDLPRGVTFCKREKRYLSQIVVDGRNRFLGYFNEPAEAADAYNQASIRYHGEFSIFNAA